jgi:hypothetical protein
MVALGYVSFLSSPRPVPVVDCAYSALDFAYLLSVTHGFYAVCDVRNPFLYAECCVWNLLISIWS